MHTGVLGRHGAGVYWPAAVGLITLFLAVTAFADDAVEKPQPVPLVDYAVYDRIVQAKFLTSETRLVLIRRMTVTRLGPEAVPFRREFFDDNQFFDGTLHSVLIADFLVHTRRPFPLEPKFDFGVRYRLVSEFNTEMEEAGLTVRPAMVYADAVEPRLQLEFSRVARSPKEDVALVYVGNYRSDGTGAGFLVVLQAQPAGWEIQDTEVVWTMR